MEFNQTQQIERAKREWEVTVDSLPQLICLLDCERHIVRANRVVERWQLGQVVEVKGQDVHAFFHAGCTNSACYLADFLDRAWEQLAQGQSSECEAEDELLKRYLHLQIQPLSPETTEERIVSSSFAVLVLDDITEQKQAEAALHRYALELKARNEELDAFAQTVAHNLKGPLLPIISYAEMIKAHYDTTPIETTLQDLDTITKNGYKISKIIDELLLLAGVRKMDVEMKPLDMAAVVTEVQQRLEYDIERHHAELLLPAASEWPVALGYAPWVEEVWANYINNSLKYGGQPPRLELGAAVLDQEGMVRFWVRDNGDGLTLKEQAKLFAPFTQLNRSQTNGYGLGLSIVRRIVEKLGGQVGVDSEGIPGQGSVFSFTLPQAELTQ